MTPRRTAASPSASLFDRPVGLIRSSCPLGRLELTSDGTAVTSLSLERHGELPHDGYVESPLDVLLNTLDQVGEYFDGSRRAFDLRLSPVGTPFQRAVWTGLTGIGFGEAKTYGQLSHDIGAGLAGRAIGSAVRANRLPLLIPCHRVLAAGGKITEYTQGNGVPTKQWLLDHEGIDYRPPVATTVWQSAAV
jgi:methylated-DNA-[protein]-cysteine S-methyltransferase